MSSRKSWARVVVGAVLAALMTGVVPVAQAQPVVASGSGRPVIPEISWTPCPADVAAARPTVAPPQPFECATVAVPLDHRSPRGRTIDLALLRLPASNPAQRIGSLFLNPGGPGGSGVDLAVNLAPFLDAQLQGRFDIVGFDPRGIARSSPLRCWRTFDEALLFGADVPYYFPIDAQQERPFFDSLTTLHPACTANGQRDLMRHMSTADVARDLDLLRQAVGDTKLSYLGFSYGSFLGATYANLFPRNVRALVIDGVLDPRLWSSGRQIESDRTAGDVVMAELLRLCDEAGCVFSGPDGAAARWERLLASLRTAPIELAIEGGTVTITYDLVVAGTFSALYDPDSWPFLVEDLDVFERLVSSPVPVGDPQFGKDLVARWVERGGATPPQEPYPNVVEGYYGNHCADAEYPSRLRDWSKIGRFAADGSVFGPMLWWTQAPCANWPVSPTRYTGPWTARTSAPVLVVGNSFDPATDLAGAQAAARLLPNSRLLTYAGWGHVAYGASECSRGHIHSYLLTGAVPRRGTVCPANPNPFTLTATSRSADVLVDALDGALDGAVPDPLWWRPTR